MMEALRGMVSQNLPRRWIRRQDIAILEGVIHITEPDPNSRHRLTIYDEVRKSWPGRIQIGDYIYHLAPARQT